MFVLRVIARRWQSSAVFTSPELRYRFPMTHSRSRRAFVRLGQLVVGPNTSLRVHAPVVIVSRGRHRRIVISRDELTLPTQGRTKIWMLKIEANRLFHRYLVVPASGSSP